MGYLVANYFCSMCYTDLDCEDAEYWPCTHCNVWYSGPESDSQPNDCTCISWWQYSETGQRGPVQGPHALTCESLPPLDCGKLDYHSHPITELATEQSGRAAQLVTSAHSSLTK